MPKKILDSLKLTKEDVIEWAIDEKSIPIESANKPFLKYKGILNEGSSEIKSDVRKAWEYVLSDKKYKTSARYK
ncbi:MAG: AbrB family transcriptional regulator [Leptospira sp.]|nr:AbrB family transcriptional regulator [Leptospira sp.]